MPLRQLVSTMLWYRVNHHALLVSYSHLQSIQMLFHLTLVKMRNSSIAFPQFHNTVTLNFNELQRTDPAISRIITLLESGNSASESLKSESPELLLMLKEMTHFELKNNVLYRRRQCDNKTVYQLVLPYVLRSSVLSSLHD